MSYHRWRAPFFGETHAHTTFSFDAVLADTRATPRDAYAFARGGSLDLTPYDAQGHALRRIQLQRPLDFAIVTDHSEYFGERSICLDPTASGYNSDVCDTFRAAIATPPGSTLPFGFLVFGIPLLLSTPTRYASVCGPTGDDCRTRAESVWQEIQAAAEEAYRVHVHELRGLRVDREHQL
ncbi:MAG TPA: DUF3604 domain-containing protein [Myxococcota bacterium]|nr:DUF3604 domain-containing protein [Myxococcota bacterium]